MKSNVTLKEMGALLEKVGSILIFPHIGIDGDALGASAALCLALRNLGKDAWVLLEEEVPAYISFLNTEFCTEDKTCIENPDVCICVDCGEESRIPKRMDKYNEGRIKMCLDHHLTGNGFEYNGLGDYYYTDSGEAAASQIIYKLIKTMAWEISVPIAEALYTGIVTDTGSFQYSNTTPETHMIAADLMALGADHMKTTVEVYQNVSLKKLMMQTKILETMEVFCGGKAVVAYVTQDMLDEVAASLEDTEDAINIIRNIEGVEIAAFLKEKDGSIKVSMRAKSYGRVDEIVAKFGGGGHMKAAGCTLNCSMRQAAETIKKEITVYLEK